MMIVMKETATEEEIGAVIEKIESAGALAHPIKGARLTVIGAIGDVEQDVNVEGLGLEGQPGVDRVMPILKPYKLAPARRGGEEAPPSRAPLPTLSKAWARRVYACWPRPRSAQACRS